MRIRGAAAWAVVAVLGGSPFALQSPAAAAADVDPGAREGARPTQAGWWTTTNEPPPDSGVAPPPAVPELTVPKGSLPVSVLGGEQQRISAIQFALDGAPGSTVESLRLVLRESTAPGSAVNVDQAAVVACPITDAFWVAAEGGPWKRRPTFDCAQGAVVGKRDAKAALWEFDLTPIAATWLDADYTGSRSIVLVGGLPAAAEGAEGDDAPSFQVIFQGIEDKGLGVVAKTAKSDSSGGPGTGGAPSGGSGGSGGAGDAGGAGGAGPTSGGGTGSGSSGTVSPGGGDLGAPAPVDVPAAPEAPIAIAADPAAPTASAVTPVAAEDRPWYSGLGLKAPILVTVAVGLAYLLMLAMGPDARPVGPSGRRGVSRALDRVRAAGVGIAGKLGR